MNPIAIIITGNSTCALSKRKTINLPGRNAIRNAAAISNDKDDTKDSFTPPLPKIMAWVMEITMANRMIMKTSVAMVALTDF